MQTPKPLTKTCRPPAVQQCCTFCKRSIPPHPSFPPHPQRILDALTHQSLTPPLPPNYLHKTQVLARVRLPVQRSRWITARRRWTLSRSTTASFWTFHGIAVETLVTAETAANKVCADTSRTAFTLDMRHFSHHVTLCLIQTLRHDIRIISNFYFSYIFSLKTEF